MRKAAMTDLKQLPDQLRQAQADNEAANAAQNAANNAQALKDQLQNQANQDAQLKQNGQTPQPPDAGQESRPAAAEGSGDESRGGHGEICAESRRGTRRL